MRFLEGLVKAKGCVGIEFSDRGISIAVKKYADKFVSSMKYFESDRRGEGNAQALQGYVQSVSLKNYDCNVVLSAKDYQLLLVESPEVSEDELREAIRWKVKDLVSEPIETKVVDVFALPDDANKANKKLLYAVVSDRKRLESLIADVNNSGLILRSIDIEVMALRNLTLLRNTQQCVAVVRVKENSGEVAIFRNGGLYLTRTFRLAYGAGVLDELPEDALALEVQRSFDYFERQMYQAPPSMIFLCGESVGPEKLTDHLKTALPTKVDILGLQNALSQKTDSENDSHYDEALAQMCLGAIGATYRKEAA